MEGAGLKTWDQLASTEFGQKEVYHQSKIKML